MRPFIAIVVLRGLRLRFTVRIDNVVLRVCDNLHYLVDGVLQFRIDDVFFRVVFVVIATRQIDACKVKHRRQIADVRERTLCFDKAVFVNELLELLIVALVVDRIMLAATVNLNHIADTCNATLNFLCRALRGCAAHFFVRAEKQIRTLPAFFCRFQNRQNGIDAATVIAADTHRRTYFVAIVNNLGRLTPMHCIKMGAKHRRAVSTEKQIIATIDRVCQPIVFAQLLMKPRKQIFLNGQTKFLKAFLVHVCTPFYIRR